MNKENTTWEETEDWLATEIIGQARRTALYWFIAWIVTLAVLIGTNTAWILAFYSK